MVAIPLIGGAYVARSVIAAAQRCVNLYPEKNPEEEDAPVTHYQTPGLTRLVTGEIGPWRGLYYASNEVLYGVLGGVLYKISSDWVLTKLGDIPPRYSIVSMADNGTTLVLVDGTSSGWSVDLQSDAFAVISDVDFYGGDFVKFMNGFFVLNRPGTRQFYASRFMAITFDPLDFASKLGASDKLAAIEVNRLELLVIGQRSTEFWAQSGAAGFPFARIDGAFLEHGCIAPHSVARYNVQVFWLSQDNNGEAMVIKVQNYQAQNISTPALSYEISKYTTISDAVGFVYQQGNHVFYVLNFPTANKTWAYDASTEMWHERTYTDENGVENRIRANCTAFAYGKNVVGDFQNGKLYAWDEEVFTDDGTPIVRRRGFPHITGGGKVMYHGEFMANIEVGTIKAGLGQPTEPPQSEELGAPALTPQLFLRWSDTRGASWGEPVGGSLGATGEYFLWTNWQDLGMTRDRVYELFWSEDCKVALNGAFVEATPLGR